MSRRNDLVIPNIFDVIDRLIKYGVLPERDYDLDWPDLTGASEEQRFERMGKMADANQKMAPRVTLYSLLTRCVMWLTCPRLRMT